MEAVSRSNALGHAGSMARGEVASAEAGACVWGPSALSRADLLCAVQPIYRRVAGKLVKAVVLLPVRSTGPSANSGGAAITRIELQLLVDR